MGTTELPRVFEHLKGLEGFEWHPQLLVDEDRFGGRGLFLSDRISQGEVLCSIPPSAIWTARAAAQVRAVADVAAELGADNEMPDRLALLVLLLYARFGKDAPESLAAYARDLPDRVGTSPLHYTLDELRLLAGTNIVASVRAKIKNLLREYYVLRPAMEAAWGASPSFSEYVWADTIYRSRVFKGPFNADSGELQEALIPMMDYCNYALGQHADLQWLLDASGAAHFVGTRNIGPGEVFSSYGDHSNEELLFQYGFVLADNPHDVTWLLLPLEADDPLVRFKLGLMQLWSAVPQLALRANGVNDTALRAAMAIELDEADAELLGEMHEEEVLRLAHISEANTRRAHALIRRLAKDALEALDAANSAVVTDDDLLGEAPLAEMANWLKANTASDGEHRARTAIIETYKRCQRKVLESFLATHSE